MSASEEQRNTWTLPCHFQTLSLMNCKSRAEAFAKSLHSKLRSLGRLTGDGQDDDDDDPEFATDFGNYSGISRISGRPSQQQSVTKPIAHNNNEKTRLMAAQHHHGSPADNYLAASQHGDDELFFDFDISSPESPADQDEVLVNRTSHRKKEGPLVTRQPERSRNGDDFDPCCFANLEFTNSSFTGVADGESGCISAVSSVITEQDNDEEVDYELGEFEEAGFVYPWSPPTQPLPTSPTSLVQGELVTFAPMCKLSTIEEQATLEEFEFAEQQLWERMNGYLQGDGLEERLALDDLEQGHDVTGKGFTFNGCLEAGLECMDGDLSFEKSVLMLGSGRDGVGVPRELSGELGCDVMPLDGGEKRPGASSGDVENVTERDGEADPGIDQCTCGVEPGGTRVAPGENGRDCDASCEITRGAREEPDGSSRETQDGEVKCAIDPGDTRGCCATAPGENSEDRDIVREVTREEADGSGDVGGSGDPGGSGTGGTCQGLEDTLEKNPEGAEYEEPGKSEAPATEISLGDVTCGIDTVETREIKCEVTCGIDPADTLETSRGEVICEIDPGKTRECCATANEDSATVCAICSGDYPEGDKKDGGTGDPGETGSGCDGTATREVDPAPGAQCQVCVVSPPSLASGPQELILSDPGGDPPGGGARLTVDVSLVPRVGGEDAALLSPTPDDDFPQKVRRSSSLKTGKTPPGTPNRKKIVRFADAMGLDLEAVKTVFLDDLPNVPSSAFVDLQDAEDPPNPPVPYPMSPAFGMACRPTRNLVPVFPQPASLADFADRVRRQGVCLESAVLAGESNVRLVIRVLNLDFNKYVAVRYTFDGWTRVHCAVADYVPDSHDGFSDKFATVVNADGLQPGERMAFAIQYVTQGREFWDNNYGQNYCFQCFLDQQYQPSPIDDSWVHFL